MDKAWGLFLASFQWVYLERPHGFLGYLSPPWL